MFAGWSQCRTANWWKSLDKQGWSKCGTTTEYLTRIGHQRVKMQTGGKSWTTLAKQKLLWWTLSVWPWNCCNRVKVSECCTFFLSFLTNSPCAFKRVTLQEKYRCRKTLRNKKKKGIATQRCRNVRVFELLFPHCHLRFRGNRRLSLSFG